MEQDRDDLKSDNIKMCQFIRELELKVRQYEQEIQDLNITHGSKTKLLKSEIKQLQKDNKSLQAKAEEANNDCERLSCEYKNLLREMSDAKFKSQEIQYEKKEDLMVIKEHEIELKRLNSKLEKYDTDKRQIIEKYTIEIEQIKDQYEKTLTVQKESLKIYKQKVDSEFEHYEKRIQKLEQKNKQSFTGSPNRHQPKERNRVSDLLRECSIKESNLKSAKSEVKNLKSQVAKLKNSNTDLKSKVTNLREIIEANPRTKRVFERQKGEINNSFKRFSPTKVTCDPNENNITVKEQNELLEQIIALKIDLNKSKSNITQLEETITKLKSKIFHFDQYLFS